MARYKNPHLPHDRRNLWAVLLWKLGYYDDAKFWDLPPKNFCYPASPLPFLSHRPSVLWIGHSTFLIKAYDQTFLTDPIWSDYCSPVPFRHLKRRTAPPFPLKDLPSIHFVLLSHNHYDHLDSKTVFQLHALQPQITWIVPRGVKKWFEKRRIGPVYELNRWQTHQTSQCCITAVPAQHFSGRTLWDKDTTQWNGYVVETKNKRLYFTGDTGYNPIDFKAIGEHWPAMDLSLIPIGTYSPPEFMKSVHINPFEAVQIHQDVRSLFSLGMHWKTFCLSDEPPNRPPYDLYLAMKKHRLPFETFLPVDIGHHVNW